MGSLYLAWDPVLERQIAIKLLREDMEELRERFDREARSVARLRHPNIVTIFDVGEQDGQPFIAMEYIHGHTLAEIIRTDPQPPVSRKLKIIDELCDGLSFAHKMAIIHRDVKPANVMVEEEGGVKILDFGIARIAESGMTMAGMLIGTLNYMSPEQISGQVVDNRSDIFAIGAVMYELLSRRQAYSGGLHNGIIHRILNEQPPALQTLCPTLDEEVIEIVGHALEKDPEARYQDLAAMRRDLQRVLQRPDETVAVSPDTAGETVAAERPEKRSSHPGRRGTPREALAKLRATQLATHLEAAQRALDAGDYEAAVSAAEHAQVLDPEEPTAAEIIERARTVLDERSVQELVKRATDLIELGSLTEALGLCDQALTIAPGTAAAIELRDAIDRIRLERERERQRLELARAATARAETALAQADYEGALAAAEEALQHAPEHESARQVHQQALLALEQAQRDALDKRAAQTTEEARRAFEAGDHEQALAILSAFEGEHPHVSETLEALTREKARLDRAAERLRRQRVDDAVALANAEPSHENAIEHLRAALAVDPSRADVARLLEDRQHALSVQKEEARQAREREERIADGLARAAAEGSHEAAISVLASLIRLAPDRENLRQALAAREAALERQREEARRVDELRRHIDALLAKAEATPDHDAAIGLLQEALTLGPGHSDVKQALQARKTALQQQQEERRRVEQKAARVATALQQADATDSDEEALRILTEALAVDEADPQVRTALDKRQAAYDRKREEEARRLDELRRSIDALLAKAETTRDHEAAIGLLQDALARDPGRSDVKQVLQARETALQQQREERRRAEEKAARVTAALQQAGATDSDEEALRILKAALARDGADPQLRTSLEKRQAAFDRKREEARKEQERQARIASAIAKASAAQSHEAAIRVLTAALDQDPGHADLTRLLDERRQGQERQQREERARREREARERRERVSAVIARARKTASHAEAVAMLQQAASQNPDEPEIRALLSERQAALAREQEEARRERERQEKVAAAIRDSKRASNTEAALLILQSALIIAPDHEEVRQLVATTQAKLAREQEEARQLRERQARVAALLKEVNSTTSHQRAIELLQEILGLEPAHREAQDLLQRRQTALEEERAGARRLADIEAARRSIVQFIAAGELDRAEASLKQAERTLSAAKLLKAEKAQLKQARAAAGRSPGRASTGRRAAPVVAVAAAAALLLVAGYFTFQSSRGPGAVREPAAPPSGKPEQSAAPPNTSTVAPQNNPPNTAPAPSPSAAPPSGAASEPTVPAPNISVDPKIAAESKAARDFLARGDLQRAAVAITRGLQIAPANQELRDLARTILNQAKQATSDARARATQRGDHGDELRRFPRRAGPPGRRGPARARQSARPRRPPVPGGGKAVRRRGPCRARRAAGNGAAGTGDRETHDYGAAAQLPAPGPASTATRPLADGRRYRDRPIGRRRHSGRTGSEPDDDSVGHPAAASHCGETGTDPAVPPSIASEEAAIRVTLREYAAAQESLSVDAVRRVYPTVDGAALARSFRELRSQRVEILSDQITIDGTNAIVRCEMRQAFTPRVGQGRTETRPSVFRLQKIGARWVIVERR